MLAVVAVFWPALGAEFVNFDDDKNILLNERFRGLDGQHLSWMFTTGRMGHYQPLSWLSLGLDHALWGLEGPRFAESPGYHATNVLLHGLTAVAFYFLVLRLHALQPVAAMRAV